MSMMTRARGYTCEGRKSGEHTGRVFAQPARCNRRFKTVELSEYVKVCSLYGAGFYYIPGTDICLKIGGYVRNQHYWGYSSSTATATPFFGDGRNTRAVTDDNLYTIRFRTIVSLDTRQQTDFGTLRTYTVLGWSQDFINQTATQLYANRAFVQFAGFTFGKAT